MSVTALSGRDLAALRTAGPAGLPGRRDRDGFWLWLRGQDFAASTQELYWEWGHRYRRWLVASGAHPDAFTDGPARDIAVREFLGRFRARPATFNTALAGIRAFYGWLGLGLLVEPLEVFPDVPDTLTEAQQSRFLEAAANRHPRDFALAALMLDVGPWPVEVRQLDVDDLDLSARAGTVRLTAPHGAVRTLALTPATTWVLMGWRAQRNAILGKRAKQERALFITLSSHRRIGERDSLAYIVSSIAKAAGLPADLRVTPMTLRATVQQRLHASGLDDASVAGMMGLSAVNAARSRALTVGTVCARGEGTLAARVERVEQLSFDLGVDS
ncbi:MULTISPECIES: tyrosine recombinase XerC [unclassified Nocardia]|uniref:site-specific integrase n=1 Tax=unclassified Nocardia TaxID=2637762 RepID=UPI00278C3F9F|nr:MULTISPECIES: site-specific integrase [unclassified Nocardia]